MKSEISYTANVIISLSEASPHTMIIIFLVNVCRIGFSLCLDFHT